MSEIIWQDPPPDGRHNARDKGRRQEFIAELKARPNEWGRYGIAVSSAVGTQIRQQFPGVEVTMRKRPDGKYDLYARWIGAA